MNCELRPICLDDVDTLMRWVNDPAIVRNFAALGEITREQEVKFIEGMMSSTTDRLFAVEVGGVMIGTAGIHRIWWPAKNGRLGLMIGHPEYAGQGCGQKALREVIRIAFDDLGLHKVWLMCYRDNARMQHIAQKLGFVEEGVLRDEYFHQGQFHDMIRHSLLEPEYRARCGWPSNS
jgi:diamine N-acetyltransferase